MEIIEAGLIGYEDGLKLQQTIWKQIVDYNRGSTIIFCEHPPVYTLGKSAKSKNLLIDQEGLSTIGATLHQTDRGGDITFHGPGQLVGYPIIKLEDFDLGVRRYVDLLEDALITTCELFNIKSIKIDGLTGIWMEEPTGTDKKIAAIGIKVSRGVTMHGFALNVNTDLNYFNHMIPCGIINKEVTSIFAETKKRVELKEVSKQFFNIFQGKLKNY
jgi:lipoyl(octanoyl) transferase